MSYTTLTHEKRKIRKPRRCFGCLESYEPGALMWYWSGVVDGHINSSYMCQFCQDWINRNCSYGDDGIFEGDLQEDKKEYLKANG